MKNIKTLNEVREILLKNKIN